MKVKPILIIAIFAFAIIAAANVRGIRAQEKTVISETRDLGWVTFANSSGSPPPVSMESSTSFKNASFSMETSYSFYLLNEWSINASCGASLPVYLTIVMPKNVAPGENITIDIGVESLLGYVFFMLEGHHYLETEIEFNNTLEYGGWGDEQTQIHNAFYFVLELLNEYSRHWNLSLETPIGYYEGTFEDVTMDLGEFSLKLEIAYEHEGVNETEETEMELTVKAKAYVTFDVTIVANTTVIGYVNVTGTALDKPLNYTLEWNNEGWKSIVVPVSEGAEANATIEPSISLEYVVHEFRIVFSNITLDLEIDEMEFENEISSELDEVMKDTTMYENYSMLYPFLKEFIVNMLTYLVSEEAFGAWGLPFNVTRTKPIEEFRGKPMAEESSNTIESESPYSEATLVFVSTVITVLRESVTGGITLSDLIEFLSSPTGILVLGGVIASLLVIGYIATRRNRG
ncbi:MAG: hypothetical protein ACTSUJ_06830 [Candidatus Njordarchaeales archaeon]